MGVILIKVIDVIGYSGSGKTYFITKAINLFKKQLNYNIAVIKNVKHHQIDKEGKDSYKFTQSGTSYSIIKNIHNDVGIFLNIDEKNIEKITKWIQKGPYKVDLILTEGFRDFNHPTALCVSNLEEVEPQLNENVKMISGMICSKGISIDYFSNLPIIDLEKDYQKFLEVFKTNKE